MVIENRAHAESQVEVEAAYRRIRKRFQQQEIPVFGNERKALAGIRYASKRPEMTVTKEPNRNDQLLQQLRGEGKTGNAAG